MDISTFYNITKTYPQLSALVGLLPEHTGRVYVDNGLAVDAVAIDPTKEPGWVSYQWEGEDELWLDGKLLWRVISRHHYNPLEVAVMVGGKVLNFYMEYEYGGSNNGALTPASQPWPLISLVQQHKWLRL